MRPSLLAPAACSIAAALLPSAASADLLGYWRIQGSHGPFGDDNIMVAIHAQSSQGELRARLVPEDIGRTISFDSGRGFDDLVAQFTDGVNDSFHFEVGSLTGTRFESSFTFLLNDSRVDFIACRIDRIDLFVIDVQAQFGTVRTGIVEWRVVGELIPAPSAAALFPLALAVLARRRR